MKFQTLDLLCRLKSRNRASLWNSADAINGIHFPRPIETDELEAQSQQSLELLAYSASQSIY